MDFQWLIFFVHIHIVVVTRAQQSSCYDVQRQEMHENDGKIVHVRELCEFYFSASHVYTRRWLDGCSYNEIDVKMCKTQALQG